MVEKNKFRLIEGGVRHDEKLPQKEQVSKDDNIFSPERFASLGNKDSGMSFNEAIRCEMDFLEFVDNSKVKYSKEISDIFDPSGKSEE